MLISRNFNQNMPYAILTVA